MFEDILLQLDPYTFAIAPLILAGLIAGAGALAGGVANGVASNSSVSDQNNVNWNIAKLNERLQRDTNTMNYNLGVRTNANNLLMQREVNKNNILLQNDMNVFNKQMWDLNNEYNSPAAQMQRAAEAGINPNVVFGTPIASSPVQQTAIPTQIASKDVFYPSKAPELDYNHIGKSSKVLKVLADLLSSTPQALLTKEQVKNAMLSNEGFKLDNKAQEIQNERDQYELDKQKEVDRLYKGNGFIENVNDPNDIITANEYEALSPEAKKSYEVDVEGKSLPNFSKLPITSKETFEAVKQLRNFPNFISNVSADQMQNRLRRYVADQQLTSRDSNGNLNVVYALAHMPEAQFNNVMTSAKSLMQEFNFKEDTNEFRAEIMRLNAEKLQSEVDKDLWTYVNKFLDKGSLSTDDIIKMLVLGASTWLGK